MGDIDFEEQLEQERLEREHDEARRLADHPQTRTDPDGTVYEWDIDKKAWFPKIDADFIAKYQMNYGVQSDEAQGSGDTAAAANNNDSENYYRYYQSYYEAGQERTMGKKKKEEVKEDTHEEMVEKLEQLESSIQQGDSSNEQGDEGLTYSKEAMEKYTEEEKKQYNEYWSYYYGTDYHDYYADCMNQYAAAENQNSGDQGQKVSSEGQGEGEGQDKSEETKGDKKKGKKRKGGAQQKRPEGWFEVEESHNTNVYVSGLPLDITDEEFKEIMNKCGLVMYDPHTRKPKLKLYRDENGEPKGDGRCCYIKKESVELALNILDDYEVRGHKIKVERANFSMKGDYDPTKKKKKLSNKEKRKLKENQAKLFDWRPERPTGTRLKHEKVVILKNLFDPSTFELNPALINTVREDVRSECSNYGEVKKVVVYDRHPDGVVSVTYKEAEEADLCVTSLHQRYFAKRRVLASTWDGKTKYEVEETEQEREERLKKWSSFLEADTKISQEIKSTDLPTDKIESSKKGSDSVKDSVETKRSNETESKTESRIEDKMESKSESRSVGEMECKSESRSEDEMEYKRESRIESETTNSADESKQTSVSVTGEG